ncbi:phospholipase A1-II 4-like [Phragmites australis]|uniref:phospholipase A1-II 4-like n=1 Tax=Phragmites australis TaxID=29695 RepID=UPI002D791F82|nr:phospholipase A1-II 4-like [Phragmites australis]
MQSCRAQTLGTSKPQGFRFQRTNPSRASENMSNAEPKSAAERWRELQGSDHWRGLLDPLDADLRRSVIRYGELAQATNDAFIREPWSPHAGASRYSRACFLDKTQASPDPAGLYEVTRFLYATAGAAGVPERFMAKPKPTSAPRAAWNGESNWMGYVAAATDDGVTALGRRDVVVAWRGTMRPMEWLNDLDFTLVPADGVLAPGDGAVPRVHRGWLSIYTAREPTSRYSKLSAREQILQEIRRLMDKYKDEDTGITIVGHSLGAAVATLNATDIVSNVLNNRPGNNGPASRRACPVTVVAFGCPRVGDASFKALFDALPDLRLLRVCNAPDVVPVYPPMGYADVGVELAVDTRRSPYLKFPGTQAAWHSLECYLHGVAGTQGSRGGFRLEVDRDVALANKNVDALREEYHVPPAWSVQRNKGMARGADGHWKLMDHEEEEDDD